MQTDFFFSPPQILLLHYIDYSKTEFQLVLGFLINSELWLLKNLPRLSIFIVLSFNLK